MSAGKNTCGWRRLRSVSVSVSVSVCSTTQLTTLPRSRLTGFLSRVALCNFLGRPHLSCKPRFLPNCTSSRNSRLLLLRILPARRLPTICVPAGALPETYTRPLPELRPSAGISATNNRNSPQCIVCDFATSHDICEQRSKIESSPVCIFQVRFAP